MTGESSSSKVHPARTSPEETSHTTGPFYARAATIFASQLNATTPKETCERVCKAVLYFSEKVLLLSADTTYNAYSLEKVITSIEGEYFYGTTYPTAAPTASEH